MLIPCIWHLGKFSWDIALPSFILSGVNICEILGIENCHIEGPIAVILISGRHSVKDYAQINECAARFNKVVFFIYGDEEGIFQIDKLQHMNKLVWWAMPPFLSQAPSRVVINGWPSEATSLIAQVGEVERVYDVSFMGQNTHVRRELCVEAMKKLSCNVKLLATPGFTQGVPREEYYRVMKQSKFVACPSGPCTVDSFRIAECLEAGAIPIADELSPNPLWRPGYWSYAFGETHLPFPCVTDWGTLPNVLDEWLPHWDELSLLCAAWWQLKKREWINQMREDLTCGY